MSVRHAVPCPALRHRLGAFALALPLALAGCGGTTPAATPADLEAARLATTAVHGQLHPAAPVGSPATSRAAALAPHGYVEEEWRLQGQARTYASVHLWGRDGQWTVAPRTAPEAIDTRVLVRRPRDPARFNGTVVVEWLNTSLGLDLDGVWMVTHDELVRAGYAWVGVSAEAASVQQLQQALPQRYGTAQLRTGDLGFDVFTLTSRVVRRAAADWGAASAEQIKLIAAGYSKSASYLITYANAFQPLTHAYDGYYLRGATPAAIQVHDFGLNVVMPSWRADLTVPVMQVQTEGEVKASWPLSDTPDSDKVRYREIAGAVHFDRHMQEQALAVGAPWGLKPASCRHPTIDLPAHQVDAQAMASLLAWVRGGQPPDVTPRLQRSANGWLQYDARGNVLGGIRLPALAQGQNEYSVYGNWPTSWPTLWNAFSCLAGGAKLPAAQP